MTKKSFIHRFIGHFSTITTHRFHVCLLCFKMGLIWQGLVHDLSKYSWIEFSSGVKYFQGNRSPIDAEKEIHGISMAWLHHKGVNKHHWEYWLDRTRNGLICQEMPKKFVKESICDRIAACRIYLKENYTDGAAYDYFMRGSDRIYMHPNTAREISKYLMWIKEDGLDTAFKKIKED